MAASDFESCQTDFFNGVAEVRLILSLDPASGTSDDESQEQAQAQPEASVDESRGKEGTALRRASVVMLVSHFEGFLKAIAESLTDVFNTGTYTAGALPLQLREMHLTPKFAEIVTAKNQAQKFALMKKLDGVSSLWKNGAKPSAGTLDSSSVARIITNGQSDCINELFCTFGETTQVCDGDLEVWNSSTERAEPANIVNGLRDVVGCRNDIAHGDAERTPTPEDLERYLSFLTALAKRLAIKAEQIESAATRDAEKANA